MISEGMNVYPHPSLKRTCDQLEDLGLDQGQGSILDDDEGQTFQEHTGGQTQVDFTETLVTGDSQRPGKDPPS